MPRRPSQQRNQSQPVQRSQQQTQQQVRQPQQQQRTRAAAQIWQQQRGWAQQGAWQSHTSWQQTRARNWTSDHRSWAQRGGYGGYYIPQNSFNTYFGSQHLFRIGALPAMYMGYPRFAYGGYSFLLLDPYPENWSDSWYSNDEVYIDYEDGYYLHNRRYPQISLAITILI
jgi:hypothetical protein